MRTGQISPLSQLLFQIDSYPPALPSQQNVFDSSSTVFYSLLQMYNSFKKQNQAKILQNKVYTLQIDDNTQQQYLHKNNLKNVTAKLLCQMHDFCPEDIYSMLKIKQYLPHEQNKQIISQIVQKLQDISIQESILSFKTALIGLKTLLRSKQCMDPKNIQLREYVQSELIQSISNRNLIGQDFEYIANFLLALPNLNEKIMILIAKLFQKVVCISQFEKLGKIYGYIYHKLDKQSITANTVKQQTLIAISIPAHLKIIKQQLQQSTVEQKNNLLKLILNQANNKMNTDFTIMTDKTEYIIQFIFFAVSHQIQLWNNFILWHWKLPQTCKQYVNTYKLPQLAQTILTNIPNKNDDFMKIIKLLLQNQNQYQISQHFVRLLLQTNNKKLTTNKIVRKFLAVKIIIDPNYYYWDTIIQDSLNYIDVILQMFQFQQALNFFKGILQQNPKRTQSMLRYLSILFQLKPIKFKQLFLHIDSGICSKIFQYADYTLIHYLGKQSDIKMALAIIREMNSYKPSSYCILILTKFLDAIQNILGGSNQQCSSIKSQIIRCLNQILMTYKQSQLNSGFKIQLKEFSLKIGNPYAQFIFKDIAKEMNQALKLFYQEGNH